ncbi:hypothetical protein ACICHK_40060 [Streptomyces sp. AHU1]|uniref:hypothetical protein n=1 Tax=Streptomyces sp. AHU1 TaxID=3377215 RepID=UPI0038783A6A
MEKKRRLNAWHWIQIALGVFLMYECGHEAIIEGNKKAQVTGALTLAALTYITGYAVGTRAGARVQPGVAEPTDNS